MSCLLCDPVLYLDLSGTVFSLVKQGAGLYNFFPALKISQADRGSLKTLFSELSL